ncbi:MAG: hypothetical protein IIW94_01485 [Clostridia bacterium]|nr:hypothetical protein [Clostridia bacterium]
MKKIISLLFTVTLILSLCACGAPKAEDVAGTYKSFSMFLNKTYQLNANSSFDKEPNIKGTYKTTSNGGFILTQANSSSEEVFSKKDNYYYRTNLICCFEKDDEYGLELSFDENGYSNQSFAANYETLNQSSMLVKKLGLILNDDGTYRLNDMQVYITQGKIVDKITFEGTYKFENDILWLNYENTDYPMLFIDGKLYFDIIEKAE